jgi:Protein of unknown function DUF45
MSFVELFIVFILVIILIMYLNNYVNSEVEYVKSSVDGRSYLVLSRPDKQEAADYIADINRSVVKLIKHMKAKHPDDPEYDKLYRTFDPNKVSEGSPDSNYTSYTINKSSMVMCIRQTDMSFVDKNVVLYVVIHELAHVKLTHEIGHTPKFWEQFKELLTEAIAMGLYKKTNYKEKPAAYCGIVLNSSVV